MSKETDHILHTVDEYFRLDAEASEEDKLLDGLKWGVEHGWLSKEEAEECFAAYVKTRNAASGDTADG